MSFLPSELRSFYVRDVQPLEEEACGKNLSHVTLFI